MATCADKRGRSSDEEDEARKEGRKEEDEPEDVVEEEEEVDDAQKAMRIINRGAFKTKWKRHLHGSGYYRIREERTAKRGRTRIRPPQRAPTARRVIPPAQPPTGTPRRRSIAPAAAAAAPPESDSEPEEPNPFGDDTH
jgi:hypothetical protein